MLDAFLAGLALAMQWPAIGFLMIGIAMGIVLGAVPGLGGALGIVLVLPFTFGMDTVSAIAILLGIFAVTSTSDTISSVLLGVPGTAASQATVLDGHALARKGEAARAFGAAFTVSAFGGVFGAVALAITLPVALPVILRFNNPELFGLGLLGLVMVGSLAGRSLAKGLAAAAFGLLLSSVGYADDQPIPRYWLGFTYLLDGLPLVPVVLGIFALPELIDLAVRNRTIANVPREQGGFSLMREGIRDALRNWWLAIRCSAIGVYVGMIPGLGGAVVDWIAYGHAKQSTKNPERYGTGDIRGVIAPEAANNAVTGGSLIPTLAFGVPGSAINALLLSALLIQGVQPGARMLTTHLPLTFSMVWTIAIANIVAAGLLMVWSRQISRLAFISGHLIVPGVLLFIFMGAWLTLSDLGDWITLLAFGAIGYAMKLGGWPRPPVILALILGGLMENSFLLSWKIHQGLGWVTRPITAVILLMVLAIIVWGVVKAQRRRAQRPAATVDASPGEEPEDQGLSILVGLGLFATFAAALLPVVRWPTLVGAFPLIAIVPGMLLAAVAAIIDLRTGLLAHGRDLAGVLMRSSFANKEARKATIFFAYCLAMLAAALLIGQKLALVALIVVYLMRWGGYGWRLAGLYGLASWIVLVGFYDRIVMVPWLVPLWRAPILAILPDAIPPWLLL